MQTDNFAMTSAGARQYSVIPLSVQKDGDLYVVGNPDMGDFYQFPAQGIKILDMIGSGDGPATIKSRLAADGLENVDVDDFVNQLTDIGFIYQKDQQQDVQDRLRASSQVSRRTFNVDPRFARAIFSLPVLACYVVVVIYACLHAIQNPALRINISALYIEENKTLLLAIVLGLSSLQTVIHEIGHMLAAARHGIKSRYGIGNRLWTIVAESDLTGILTLPKSQRYLPMLAGLLVDILSLSLFTILLDTLLQRGAGPFTIQVIQVMVLETAIAIAWQFNVFVKTDIYFVLCNYFSYPDLDKDARAYLRHVLYRVTFGRFGREAPPRIFSNLIVLQIFALVWSFGRVLSLFILFAVFLPTMWQYLESALQLLSGPPASVWMACDTIIYVTIMLTMLGAGMYVWLKHR
jgi:putative peptide zinc metalloprotease protein